MSPLSSSQRRPHQWSGGDVGTHLSRFAADTNGVSNAIVISSDGFLLATSTNQEESGVEQLAAIISGLTSLAKGAADLFVLGDVRQVIVELAAGSLFVMSISDGSALAAVADADCDMGTIGYEMTLLVDRLATILTPDVIDVLKNTLDLDPEPSNGR